MALEIVTLVPPLFVSTKFCDCVPPTVTVPKASLEGFEASCPSLMPVPFSVMFVMAEDASLPIAALAVKVPAAFGVKASVRDTLCPAATVSGRLGAVREKYLVETVALLIVTEVLPTLFTARLSDLLVPAATLPKFNVTAPNERVPAVVGFELGELDELELNP